MSIWRPHPGPQRRFFSKATRDVLFVLFGGAAGGGKSDCLIIEAASQVHFQDYRGIIFRRTTKQLRELTDKSLRYYPALGGIWKKSENCWHFPSGAKIYLSHLQLEETKLEHQGFEYQFIGFDELTHFTQTQFEYLTTRLRTPNTEINLMVRATANPGGPGHGWVKAYFVDVAEWGQVYIDPKTGFGRLFIHATLEDNPSLAGTDYARQLNGLNEADKQALLHGNWNAYSGQVFNLRHGVHIVKHEDAREVWRGSAPPSHWPRFMVMDWGWAEPFAIYWAAQDPQNCLWVYREWYGVKYEDGKIIANKGIEMAAEDVAARIQKIERDAGERISVRWCGSDVSQRVRGDLRDHRYGQREITVATKMASAGIHFRFWDVSAGSRVRGRQALHDRLTTKLNEDGTTAGPWIKFVKEATEHAQRTLPALRWKPSNPEDVDDSPGQEDHAYDALNRLCLMRTFSARQKEIVPGSARDVARRARRGQGDRVTLWGRG